MNRSPGARLQAQWDRWGAWACAVAGVVLLIFGWVGVDGEKIAGKQLPYIISAGLGGIFLLGAAAVLWLSADMRQEWRSLDRIEASIRARNPGV